MYIELINTHKTGSDKKRPILRPEELYQLVEYQPCLNKQNDGISLEKASLRRKALQHKLM